MENAFYAQGLAKFTHDDFIHAGFPDWSYGRLKQIAAHEAAHVKLLETTLGDKATKPCAYNLSVTLDNFRASTPVADVALSSPYDDPKSFITLSHALEAVGKYLRPPAFLLSHFFYSRGLGIHRRDEVIRRQGRLAVLSSLDPRALIVGSKEYLLAAATILSTESRHSGWLDSVMRQGSAWSGPFDVRSTLRDSIRY